MIARHEIHVRAKTDQVEDLIDTINRFLDEYHCAPKTQAEIDIAVDEIFSNIVFYAYRPSEGDARIQCTLDETNVFRICFIDTGAPYDPLIAPDPDITQPLEQRTGGGLGVFIVKNIMDDVRYEYINGENHLTIAKQI